MSVIGFFCSCIRDGDVATDRWFAGCDRAMMCVLPLAITCIQAFCACFEEHPIISGESSHRGDLEGLVQQPTTCRLGLPVIEGHWQLALGRR